MNLRKIILILVAWLYVFTVSAGDKKYPVSDIPPTLLLGSNAVIREYKIDFNISSLKKLVKKCRYVVTILNENSKDEGMLVINYDPDVKIHYVRGNLYDKSGNLVKKLKKSEIKDQSAISSFSIYEDDRVKYAELQSNVYPYTVEFEYEIENNSSLFYPFWTPINDKKLSLQHASLDIYAPIGTKVRYKTQNMDSEVKVSQIGDKSHYHWELSNVSPIKSEPYGPKFSDLKPIIYTAPTDFSKDGYAGNMETWESFGQWINLLNSGRDELPEATKQKIISLTAHIKYPREKIKKIYQYLQQNTRYVSIQLGIGGWQPFKASFVDEKKYGDCKALSNYTKALLEVAGINSHYTLVYAGKDAPKLQVDFPINQFNHVILCVPNNNDTIWLECTNQTNPYGYLGSSTGDRDVLIITEQGGKVVHTPIYKQNDNRKITKASVQLDGEGNANIDLHTTYSGLQVENDHFNYYINASYENQKKWLYKKLDVSGARINEFKLDMAGDEIPTGKESIDLSVPKYASVNGKRLFLQPNMFNKANIYAKKIQDRKSPFILSKDEIDADTIVYHLPKGYYIEFQPETIHYESDFGEYTSKIKVGEGILTYYRTLKINKGSYDPKAYEDFINFVKKITKSDNSKVVFVNRT